MSDVVWQALIAAFLAIYMEWSRRKTAEKVAEAANEVRTVKAVLRRTTAEQSEKLDAVAENVQVIHKATNSIKDELVAATDRAARSEGHEAGRIEAEQQIKRLSPPEPR